jgi:hypothetical protein
LFEQMFEGICDKEHISFGKMSDFGLAYVSLFWYLSLIGRNSNRLKIE